MRDDIGKRMIFAHDEVEVDVVFPLRPLSEREYFHRGEREERRHLDIRTESLRVRYFVFEMIERYLDGVRHESELRIFFDENPVDNGVSTELPLQFFGHNGMFGILREEVEVD